MKYSKKCEHCGSRVSAYTHNLNKSMAQAFFRVVNEYMETGRPVRISCPSLRLSHNQIANFQKLKYYDLVTKCQYGNGLWYPTPFGIKFFRSEVAVTIPVATLNGEVLPETHEAWDTHTGKVKRVYFHQITESPYKPRVEYQAEKSAQSTMF